MVGILQTLHELAGVNAAMVFDVSGRLLAWKGHSVYDEALLSQVSGTIVKAIDSISLRHDDWDSIIAQYADGKLLLRNLGAPGGGRGAVLAVVADADLNPSFATVAMRVAVAKLRKLLEAGPGAGAELAQSGVAASAPSLPPAMAAAPAAPAYGEAARPGSQPSPAPRPSSQPAQNLERAAANASSPVLTSGLSWSGISGSSGSGSGVSVADRAAADFITRLSRELARHVGPMSKLYVKEGIRKVSPGAPFSLAQAAVLVAEVASHIEDPGDRTRFLQLFSTR